MFEGLAEANGLIINKVLSSGLQNKFPDCVYRNRLSLIFAAR